MENLLDTKIFGEVVGLLKKHGIPYEAWGQHKTKSLADLLREISEGETRLIEEGGELLRNIKVLNLAVTHVAKDGKHYRLREDRQEFSDKSVRRRTKSSGMSVSEKMLADEDLAGALERAVREELGITGTYDAPAFETLSETKDSPSYPGLKTKYDFFLGSVALIPSDFALEGYREAETPTGIVTYFVWDEEA